MGKTSAGLAENPTVHLPNLKTVFLDRCHASTRLAKHFFDDPFLANCFGVAVADRRSITKLIMNSPDIKAMFVKHAKALEGNVVKGDRVKDLGYAKQRFSSTQKPLTRHVLFFPAMIATACEVSIRRKDSAPGKAAAEYLGWLDSEKAIQLALMADAGEEVNGFLRFYDDPQYDIADAPGELRALVQRLNVLFIQQKAGSLETYTKVMLQRLDKGVHIAAAGQGQMRRIGRPTGNEMARAYGRMTAWVRLVIARLEAEFPDTHVLDSFSLFKRDAVPKDAVRPKDAVWPSDQFLKRCCERLGQVWNLAASNVASEYRQVAPFVAGLAQKGDCEPWITAMKRLNDRRLRQYKTPALMEVIARYAAFRRALKLAFARVGRCGRCCGFMMCHHG